MPNWKKTLKWERKEKEKTLLDEPMLPYKQASVYLVHYVEGKTEVGTIGWTDSPFCRCVEWLEGVELETLVAPDDPTVELRTSLVYLMLHSNQDRDAPRLELQNRMNRRWSSSSSDALEDADSKVLATSPSTPDVPTHNRSIVSEQFCQWSWAVEATTSRTGWTDARKIIALDHPTVLLLAAFSQRLVWCLRLFIPSPLTHLRLLESVEVQESARHLEDHIQSIQVVNCSSLDLHMLYACS
jgi:hypothetical protein